MNDKRFLEIKTTDSSQIYVALNDIVWVEIRNTEIDVYFIGIDHPNTYRNVANIEEITKSIQSVYQFPGRREHFGLLS